MRQLKIIKSITNRESESLEKYLQEIGRDELLSSEEEVELAQLLLMQWKLLILTRFTINYCLKDF